MLDVVLIGIGAAAGVMIVAAAIVLPTAWSERRPRKARQVAAGLAAGSWISGGDDHTSYASLPDCSSHDGGGGHC